MKPGRIRVIAAVILVPLLCVIALLAGLYLYLQTDSGREAAARQIEQAVHDPEGLSLEVGSIHGNLFSSFSLSSLLLRDPSGAWLEIKNITLDWSPLALVGGNLKINKVLVSSLDLKREPVIPDSVQEEQSSGPLLPLPINISLTEVQLAEVHIAESVLGREALLKLSLNLKSEVEGVILSSLDIIQLDAHEGSMTARVEYDPKAETLSVDVKLTEPEGGLIARALDLPSYPEINVNFNGQGPINDWKGEVNAQAGTLFSSDLSLHSSGYNSGHDSGETRDENSLNLYLSGGVQLDKTLASSIPLIDDKRATLDAQISWDYNKNLVSLVSSQIKNTTLDIAMVGAVDLGQENLNFAVSSRLLQPSELNKLIAPVALSRGNLDLDATGTFQNINLTVTFQAGGVALDKTLTVGDVIGSISSDLLLDNMKTIPVTGSVALTEISGLPPEAVGLLGHKLRLELDSNYILESGVLNIPLLRAQGEHLNANMRAALATRENTASAEISLFVDDLSSVAPVKGKLLATGSLQSLNIASDVTGKISLQAQQLDSNNPDIQVLVSSEPSMTANVKLSDESLQITNVALTLPTARLGGSVEFPLSFESLSGEIEAVMEDLGSLNKLAGTNLKGVAKLNSTLSGPISDPELRGTLLISELNLEQNALGNLETNFQAKNLASGAEGILKTRLAYPKLPTDLALAFSLPAYTELKLSDISLKAQNSSVTGALIVPFDGTPIAGGLTGRIPDLGLLTDGFGIEAQGNGKVDAVLSNSRGQQHLALDLSGSNLSNGATGPVIKSLTIEATATGDLKDPALVMRAKASDISVADRIVEQFDFTAQGKAKDADFTFNLSSSTEPALQLKGQGGLTLPASEQITATKLQFLTLNGNLAQKEIVLRTPLTLIQDKTITSVAPFELSFDRGTFTGSGELTEKSATADLKIKTFPLELLTLVAPELEITGTLEGDAKITLMPENYQGQFSLTAANVQLAGDDNKSLPPLTSRLTATLDKGRFDFKNKITGLEPSTLEVYGSVPVAVGLAPFSVSLPNDQKITGGVKADSDISRLWSYLALDTQEMTGQLFVDTQLSGTLSNPVIVGGAKVTNGRYENVEFGTLLRQIELNATIQNSQTLLLMVDAKDSKGGSLKSGGTIEFKDLVNPLVDLTIQLDNLAALDQDQISVQTDGNIEIKGTPAGLKVGGDITTGQININIGSAVAPSVVSLDVTEKNRPGAAAPSVKKEKKPPSKVSLDLLLSMPRKVFIRGQGLDSEWEGQFTIKGTADTPIIEGYLSPVRGYFSFAGKDFKLQKGKITLLGGTEINPELNLSAIYKARNVTAVVSINGTATNPKISLSSPDGLPQDEVLSQVIFDKAAGKLSPIEALQLASAIASLSGKIDSGGGIVDFARETLGVDVLSAGTNSETGDAQVSVGKYISDSIYVGVDQGASTSSTRAKVQIELTPNITLESETGQTADSKVGVFWKWDY
ncbi:MAG: translocation/assembly module TamB domain-containing protein [Halopseudomonas aestusnigri]